MRIFKSKRLDRFASHERISDASLRQAVERAASGSVDADLGGGLIKQRVARRGQGRSGGFRMIIAYRAGSRAVFLYGFAKNERTNISEEELLTLRTIGANWLSAPMAVLRLALTRGDLREIEHDKEKS